MRHESRDAETRAAEARTDRPRSADTARGQERPVDQSDTARQPRVPIDHLRLPSGRWRQRVVARDGRYRLRGSQSQTLAILGTFRVVRADELPHYGPDFQTRDRDLRSLKGQGLIVGHARHTRRGHRYEVLTLTDRGKTLLESAGGPGSTQRYHAGMVKPRELRHDLALYRMYREEAGRLEAVGARIRRITLDAEIKGEYQRHVNKRADEHAVAREGRQRAREEFATAYDLPIIDGHLEIPDLRIEYETADGEVRHVDLELATEHYRREHIAGKTRAGFVVYRQQPRRGGTPDDEFEIERLLS